MGYNNVRYDIENDWSQTVTHSPRLYGYVIVFQVVIQLDCQMS